VVRIVRRGAPLVAALLVACGDAPAGPGGGLPPYVPGVPYFGTHQYVEYLAGDLPVIVLAPHGGAWRPAEMPDRASPDTLRDANTQELVRAIDSAFVAATGHHPHVVICRVHRVKLDCNREESVGAGSDPDARAAWEDFQRFVGVARAAVVAASGRGLLLDVHGHGHTVQRLELGYLLSGADLGLADSVLDQTAWRDSTSVRDLLGRTVQPLTAVLRGPSGLGTLFAAQGYAAVPSASDPRPDGAPYFDGGYKTLTYGSWRGGTVNAVQVESNYTAVRDTPANRAAFARAFVGVVRAYVSAWLGLGI
jgi:hypothetical protein